MADLPIASHEGILKIGNAEIRVYVVDGKAIIHADDIMKVFEADFNEVQAQDFLKELKNVTRHD